MSRLLKITDLGSGIMVQGTDNVLYPDNATLTYPYNSIIVVTDESDIATFRSASNNDVLFSGLIGKIEIGGEVVTKENINAKFDAIANQESGGGGSFADASYDSQTKRINFYDKDGNIVSYIDATDFIKDGMVSNVEILNGNLVITFNTDAGKENIEIPLSEIFNPNEYYTKTEIDAKEQSVNASIALKANIEDVYDKQTADSTFATQVVVNEEIASRIEAIRDVNTALGTKADKSDTYTKTQVDDALALKQDASTAFSGDYNDLTNKPTNVSAFTNDAGYLTEHQSLDNYYTKSEVDTALSEKVDKSDFDTKEEVVSTALNELEENKQDKLTAGQNITIQNNVISASGGTQQQADWNQSDSTAVDYIKNKPTIPDTSDYVSIAQYNPKELAIAEALTELNENKADKTELPDISPLATKTEVEIALSEKADKSDTYTKVQTDTAIQTAVGQIDLSDYQTKADADVKEEVISAALNVLNTNKQDTLISGTNIKTINNESILGEGNIEIQGGGGEQQQADWNQTDTTAVDYIKNKPTIPVVPTNVSAFTNDAGYLTQHQSLANYYTKSEIDAMIGNINTILASI